MDCLESDSHDWVPEYPINKDVHFGHLRGSRCSHEGLKRHVDVPSHKLNDFQNAIYNMKDECKDADNVIFFHEVIEGLMLLRVFEKKTLKDEIGPSGISLSNIIRYGSHITTALLVLHMKEIASLNIKPSNILLNKENKAFVCDICLPIIFKECNINLKSNSRHYAAPEIWNWLNGNVPSPSKEALKQADVWSFGCMLFEMCTGNHIWGGELTQEEIQEFVEQKMLPVDLKGQLLQPLLGIISECLEFDAQRRPTFFELKRKFSLQQPPMVLHKNPQIVQTSNQCLALVLKERISRDDIIPFMSIMRRNPSLSFQVMMSEFPGMMLLACQIGSSRCLKELCIFGSQSGYLARRFLPDITNENGDNMLFLTIQKGYNECALLITTYVPELLCKTNSENKSPLYLCIEMGNLSLLKEWVKKSRSHVQKALELLGPMGTPPPHLAAHQNNEGIIKILISLGAHKSRNDQGESLMHIAAMRNKLSLMKMLIGDGKCDVDIRDGYNSTPLQISLKFGAESCAKELLSSGASCILKDDNGDNAFLVAAQAAIKFPHNMKLLLVMLKNLTSDAAALNCRNFNGLKFEDIIKRLPQKTQDLISAAELKRVGIDMHVKMEEMKVQSTYNIEEAVILKAKENLRSAFHAEKIPQRCTLIITEGQAAKSFVEKGIESLTSEDQKYYGTYTLTGKPVNVSQMKEKGLMENAVVEGIFTVALGMNMVTLNGKPGFVANNSLKYGRVLILTDQDLDGSHIKGLLLNMFYCLCPNLLKRTGFIVDLNTNLIKATNRMTKEVKLFKSNKEYEAWECKIIPSEWTFDYNKGLAANHPSEAKGYFENLEERIRYFLWDGQTDENHMNIAFNKNMEHHRKLMIYNEESKTTSKTTSSINSRSTKYSTFIVKELVPFFIEDNERTIPSMMDGLKPSQRKIIFVLFEIFPEPYRRMHFSEIAHLINEHSFYYHRQSALLEAIGRMSCDKQSVRLLQDSGYDPEKKLNSATYYKTGLQPIFSYIFKTEDNGLLKRIIHKGKYVEPQWYAPIIPIILINGCHGIGCGFSTNVQCFKLEDVINNLKRLMDCQEPIAMRPFDNKKKQYVKAVNMPISLFNDEGSLVYYSSPQKVLGVFFKKRLELYQRRNKSREEAIALWMKDLDLLEAEMQNGYILDVGQHGHCQKDARK